MKPHALAILIPLLLASCASAPEPAPEPAKPNFVLIFIDDMGYGDIGPFGSTVNRTPNLDRMAAEGMKLTSFYAHPVCTPSRASLMTGSYPIRNGLQTGYWHPVLMPADPQGINPDEITVAEALKEQGYATGIIGKWHLGDQPEFLPNKHGFDYYFGLPYSNDMNPFMPLNPRNHPPLPLLRNGEVIREVPEDQSFLTGEYTREALGFIDAHKDEPFFLYLPHSMVHVPLWAGEDFKGKSNNEILGDCIEELDWSVGEVRQKLEELGLTENTLVFFTSDNGPARGSAGPLRGRKGSTYEGGLREPAIAWWPGTVPAGSEYGDISSTMDILPTFAALAGGSVPADRTDGHDISAILKGAVDQPSEYEAFYYYRGYTLSAVRSGNWKLHINGELYDLEGDIAESRDVAADHPDVVAQLEALIEVGRREIGDGPLWPGEPGIRVPPTARPVGKIDRMPKLLIPRHGLEGDAAHEPPVRTKTTPPPPADYVRPANW
jgi:arylsulfatase A-like enzyme